SDQPIPIRHEQPPAALNAPEVLAEVLAELRHTHHRQHVQSCSKSVTGAEPSTRQARTASRRRIECPAPRTARERLQLFPCSFPQGTEHSVPPNTTFRIR